MAKIEASLPELADQSRTYTRDMRSGDPTLRANRLLMLAIVALGVLFAGLLLAQILTTVSLAGSGGPFNALSPLAKSLVITSVFLGTGALAYVTAPTVIKKYEAFKEKQLKTQVAASEKVFDKEKTKLEDINKIREKQYENIKQQVEFAMSLSRDPRQIIGLINAQIARYKQENIDVGTDAKTIYHRLALDSAEGGKLKNLGRYSTEARETLLSHFDKLSGKIPRSDILGAVTTSLAQMSASNRGIDKLFLHGAMDKALGIDDSHLTLSRNPENLNHRNYLAALYKATSENFVTVNFLGKNSEDAEKLLATIESDPRAGLVLRGTYLDANGRQIPYKPEHNVPAPGPVASMTLSISDDLKKDFQAIYSNLLSDRNRFTESAGGPTFTKFAEAYANPTSATLGR